MADVRLVGPSGDGRRLVVSTDGGEEYTLPVTAELKSAVSGVDDAGGAGRPALSPKEIQRRVRAGFTARELADLTGAPVASIERYVGPVIAERDYIAELARATRVTREAGAPPLGEVVTDRLASRGVGAKALQWDAFRVAPDPWKVVLRYPEGSRMVEAVWAFDHVGRSLSADDEHSRRLSEIELLGAEPAPRHLAPVRPGGDPQAAASHAADEPFAPRVVTPIRPEPEPAPPPPSTEEILDDLLAKRGTREAVALEDDEDEEFEGFGPQRAREAEFSVASGGEGLTSTDGGEKDAPESGQPAPRGGSSRTKRRGRASMPSWDEIVFGAKGD